MALIGDRGLISNRWRGDRGLARNERNGLALRALGVAGDGPDVTHVEVGNYSDLASRFQARAHHGLDEVDSHIVPIMADPAVARAVSSYGVYGLGARFFYQPGLPAVPAPLAVSATPYSHQRALTAPREPAHPGGMEPASLAPLRLRGDLGRAQSTAVHELLESRRIGATTVQMTLEDDQRNLEVHAPSGVPTTRDGVRPTHQLRGLAGVGVALALAFAFA